MTLHVNAHIHPDTKLEVGKLGGGTVMIDVDDRLSLYVHSPKDTALLRRALDEADSLLAAEEASR